MYELSLLFVGLFFFALVGHLLWLMGSALMQAVFGVGAPAESGERRHCAACGKELHFQRCPWCGFDQAHLGARELLDLAATRRQLDRFLDADLLDRQTYEALHVAVDERHARLLGKPVPLRPVDATPVIAVESEAITVHPAAQPAWQNLEKLLTTADTGVDQQALDTYRQAKLDELERLIAPAQLALARLLARSGMHMEALSAFERFLNADAADRHAAVALEAARLACQVDDARRAGWFIEQVLARNPDANLRAAALELQETLALPTAVAVVSPEPAVLLEAQPIETAPAVDWQPEPEPAPRQRRNFAEVLHAFMERSNILWGELVGGLLIVGCSMALVLSLWSKFADNPLYQSAIFTAVTAMMFGAGLYTLHHWKLESTSRGLLIIAALLVPLNFLASASQPAGAGSVTGILFEMGSLGLFAWLLLLTGRVLVPGGGAWFAASVLGASASCLLFPKMLGTETGVWLMPALGLVPVACHALGCGGWIVRGYRRDFVEG
ncbi:MAG: hypothetical protein AB7K24_09505, partial [Gemmataceae bacterium]